LRTRSTASWIVTKSRRCGGASKNSKIEKQSGLQEIALFFVMQVFLQSVGLD